MAGCSAIDQAKAVAHNKMIGVIGANVAKGFRGKLTLNLEEMKKQIEILVAAKGFYNKPEDIPKKLLFAFIELGEASDAWKKGLPEEKIA